MMAHVRLPPLTPKQRIAVLKKRTGLNLTELAKRAGIKGKNNLRTVDALDRSSINSETAYRLAYAHKVSLAFMTSGNGSPDDGDVPRLPWPDLSEGRIQDLPAWPELALKAISHEKGKLDWAVMAVGEMLAEKPMPDLTVYAVLSEAEKIAKRLENDLDERQRLDAKLRDFMAEHADTRSREREKPSGRHRRTTDRPKK